MFCHATYLMFLSKTTLDLCFCQVVKNGRERTHNSGSSRGTSYECKIVKNIVDLFLFCLFVGRKGGWDCDHTLHGTLPCVVKRRSVILISKGRDLEF